MKQTTLRNWGALAIVGLGLALTGIQVNAATTTNAYPFDTGIPGWGIGWGGQGNVTWDGAQDSMNDPNSGSAYIEDDWAGYNGAASADQLVALGWFSGGMWYNPASAEIDLTTYTNISFDIKWDNANSTIDIGTFNSTGETLRLWIVPQDNSSWIDLAGAPRGQKRDP